MRPERPDLRPERLDLRPERLDLRLERPDLGPVRPDFMPERPDLRPERLDLRPERPDLRPERPDWGSERPDLRSQRPDLRPEGPDEGGGQTNEQTNGRTKVPLCSTGLCPLWGRCPASPPFNSQSLKAAKRVSLTTYCPWATCSPSSMFPHSNPCLKAHVPASRPKFQR